MAEVSWHLKGICDKGRFWLEEHRNRAWEDMKGYLVVRNHTNCMDLWMLGRSAWRTTQISQIYESSANVCGTNCWERSTVFISYNEIMFMYCLEFPFAPPPPPLIAQSASIISALPYAVCWLIPAKMNRGGGEKPIFSPPWPPSASLSSLNRCLHVLLQVRSSAICQQIDHMHTVRETLIYSTCQIMM